jgi:hypothetical protein
MEFDEFHACAAKVALPSSLGANCPSQCQPPIETWRVASRIELNERQAIHEVEKPAWRRRPHHFRRCLCLHPPSISPWHPLLSPGCPWHILSSGGTSRHRSSPPYVVAAGWMNCPEKLMRNIGWTLDLGTVRESRASHLGSLASCHQHPLACHCQSHSASQLEAHPRLRLACPF